MNPRKTLLPLIVGLAAGAALGVFVDRPARALSAESAPANAPAREPGSDLAAQLSEAQDEIERLRQEVARLEAEPRATQASGASPAGFVRAVSGPPSKEERERMVDEMRPHMRRFIEGRLSRYQMRLGLDDTQFQAMSDLMLLQQEQRHLKMMAAHEARANGGDASAAAPEGVSTRDLLDMASEILTPEQYEEYRAIVEEERASRNEMMATARLSQMSSALKLTDEQKDAAYSVFYGEADKAGDEPVMTLDPESRKAVDEALGKILTKEQFDAYQQLQQQQGMANAVFMGG